MSIIRRTIHEWTCDRCGARGTSDEQDRPPNDEWLELRQPTKGRVGELCASCSAEFREFMLEGRDAQSEFACAGAVTEAGGRVVSILVDEDTVSYPAVGDRLKVWRSVTNEGDETDA